MFLDQKLISYRFFLFLLERPPLRILKPKAPPFQIGSGWNLADLFLKVNLIRIDWRSYDVILLKDSGHDVMSRNKVLPPGECDVRQFLIYSTLILVYSIVVFPSLPSRPQTHIWHILRLRNASGHNNFNDFPNNQLTGMAIDQKEMAVWFQADQRSDDGIPYRRIPSHFEPCR